MLHVLLFCVIIAKKKCQVIQSVRVKDHMEITFCNMKTKQSANTVSLFIVKYIFFCIYLVFIFVSQRIFYISRDYNFTCGVFTQETSVFSLCWQVKCVIYPHLK